MLSPAHEQYARFMRLRNGFTLHGVPYVVIVHGSGDKTVPLDDSIRLLETADGPGRSRLEVISKLYTQSLIGSGRSALVEVALAGELGKQLFGLRG